MLSTSLSFLALMALSTSAVAHPARHSDANELAAREYKHARAMGAAGPLHHQSRSQRLHRRMAKRQEAALASTPDDVKMVATGWTAPSPPVLSDEQVVAILMSWRILQAAAGNTYVAPIVPDAVVVPISSAVSSAEASATSGAHQFLASHTGDSQATIALAAILPDLPTLALALPTTSSVAFILPLALPTLDVSVNLPAPLPTLPVVTLAPVALTSTTVVVVQTTTIKSKDEASPIAAPTSTPKAKDESPPVPQSTPTSTAAPPPVVVAPTSTSEAPPPPPVETPKPSPKPSPTPTPSPDPLPSPTPVPTPAPSPSTPWSISQSYSGSNFLSGWDFFTYPDPTHGMVNFLDSDAAHAAGLVSTTSNGATIMKVDNTTWLGNGQYRNSVRITSKKTFGVGSLVVMDAAKMPYGKGVWPAFWSVGANWPNGGEIDIMEGVNDNAQNEYTLHTGPGCNLATPMQASGNVLSTNCDVYATGNSGCGVQEPSTNSYGAGWNAVGGGVYAMEWTTSGISMYIFNRDKIPADLASGNPNPANWGSPRAFWANSACDTNKFFAAQSLIFDITLCGDWAGSAYGGTYGGNCADSVVNPGNYDNAVFEVNSVKVWSLKQ